MFSNSDLTMKLAYLRGRNEKLNTLHTPLKRSDSNILHVGDKLK
jgi:hypothetical protein